MADSEVIARAKQKQRGLLELYEKTRLRTNVSLAVPTIDADVKAKLRSLGEPICLFGEDAFDRRERLKILIGTNGDKSKKNEESKEDKKQEEVGQASTFYTIGSASLLQARRQIAESSKLHATQRLELERESLSSQSSSHISDYWDSMEVVSTSQVGDTRPLTAIALCPFTPAVAVAGWSGDINVFHTDSSVNLISSLKGHEDRCSALAWMGHNESPVHLASGGADKTIRLWSLSGETSHSVIEGHEMRVNKIAVHPHLNHFIFSTSEDETWRLWDIEKHEELLLQEGHIGSVYGLAVHPDGSLVATGDTGGIIRIWDIRSGKAILDFPKEHVDQVVGLDFAQNGFSLASCSGDNSVRIFDLRKKENVDILTAHTKLVSSVKFGGQRGDTLMTAGYDCVARVWRTSDFKIVKNLPLHETRIMAADMSKDGLFIATACYDRTFKLWSNPAHSRGVKMEVV
jgi:U4/U6 small nuclear ribonucleoprotein PRP4